MSSMALSPAPFLSILMAFSLHNVGQDASAAPLLIHIPSFHTRPEEPPRIPSYLESLPTAVINYRWPGSESLDSSSCQDESVEEIDFATPLHWPTPLHDLLFGYSWILENLAAPSKGRRDVYVHGSYLGASLAASLALTESHKHERMAVRGFVAYNGIYNWTMFLPDHKINKPARGRKVTSAPPPQPEPSSSLHLLRQEIDALFKAPVDLFDPFASPSLHFQTAGMLVPTNFHQTAAISSLVDRMSTLGIDGSAEDLMPSSASALKAPRRSSLIFPPRKSTLKIPETLLLHDTAVLPAVAPAAPRRKKKPTTTVTARQRKAKGNHFEAQASELAELMKRSMEKVEFKERMRWDEDFDDLEGELDARVKVIDIGEPEADRMKMNIFGAGVVRRWLEERF